MQPIELRVLIVILNFNLFIFMPFHISSDLDIETVECNFFNRPHLRHFISHAKLDWPLRTTMKSKLSALSRDLSAHEHSTAVLNGNA
jgi:hypothetical protein